MGLQIFKKKSRKPHPGGSSFHYLKRKQVQPEFKGYTYSKREKHTGKREKHTAYC
jgi:hypothetical protein